MCVMELFNPVSIKQFILSICLVCTITWVFCYTPFFSTLVNKNNITRQLVLVFFFSFLSWSALNFGFPAGPGIVSMRLLGPMLGGLLYGPAVGAGTGVISGLIRYSQGTDAALYVSVSTVAIGLAAGGIHLLFKGNINIKNGVPAIAFIELLYDFTGYAFLGREAWWQLYQHMILQRTIADILAVTIFLKMFDMANMHKKQLDFYQQLSRTDYSTGVSNYRHLNESLCKLIKNARERNLPLTVAIFSLNDFEAFQKGNGYREANRLAVNIILFFKEQVGGMLFRLPRNWIACILFEPREQALCSAVSIKESVENEFVFNNKKLKDYNLSLIYAVCSYPEEATEGKGLLETAADRLDRFCSHKQ